MTGRPTLAQLVEYFVATATPAREPVGVNRAATHSNAAVVERMFNRKTGERAQALYNGNFEGLYSSQSEAVLALLNYIAFETDDREQTAQVFEGCALYRESKYANPTPVRCDREDAMRFRSSLPTVVR